MISSDKLILQSFHHPQAPSPDVTVVLWYILGRGHAERVEYVGLDVPDKISSETSDEKLGPMDAIAIVKAFSWFKDEGDGEVLLEWVGFICNSYLGRVRGKMLADFGMI